MKMILVGGAALALVAGCANVTDWTGLTNEEQICIITEVGSMAQEAEISFSVALANEIAASCGVDLTQTVLDIIETAIGAADIAQE